METSRQTGRFEKRGIGEDTHHQGHVRLLEDNTKVRWTRSVSFGRQASPNKGTGTLGLEASMESDELEYDEG